MYWRDIPDIEGFIDDKESLIKILTRKWINRSNLEDYDKFRYYGAKGDIFWIESVSNSKISQGLRRRFERKAREAYFSARKFKG
tara:strand:- start:499 stop:750 length:252 start_codon:yes stop_codon:yes gene_type:complete